ncbi:IclR family transcriptional regulator [Virgibacillus halophilus]|uniref:IclR family transcriptional regulator n=1 Tax=Tigheibacillus halophilus TaxID=361280 RepID=A0ABU5CA88_9BACI|nr:IclR family transcriptional regulator [Virgibacillus halophilus]
MNQSVIKALKLLDLFTAETPELALRDIADQANMPKPTVYRLLTALESLDYIHKVGDTGNYRLGLKLLELGRLVSDQLEVRTVAFPFMQQLAMKINEAVHLVIANQNQATYIEKVDSNQALRLFTKVGKSSPLHIGSGPKLLFAFMSAEKQIEIMRHLMSAGQGQKSFLKEDELFDQLQKIRDTGYAYSIGEQDEDTTGISYPIYDFRNHVVASLTVSGLSSHFIGKNLEFIKKGNATDSNHDIEKTWLYT